MIRTPRTQCRYTDATGETDTALTLRLAQAAAAAASSMGMMGGMMMMTELNFQDRLF